MRGNATPWDGSGAKIAALAKAARAPVLRYEEMRNTPPGGNYNREDPGCIRSRCNLAMVLIRSMA